MSQGIHTGGIHCHTNTGQSMAGKKQWLPGRGGLYNPLKWQMMCICGEDKGSSQTPVRTGVWSAALPSWIYLISEANEIYPLPAVKLHLWASVPKLLLFYFLGGDNVLLRSWPRPLYVVQAGLQLPVVNASEAHTGGAGWDTLTLGLPEAFLGPPSSTCLGRRRKQPCQGCTSVKWLKRVEPLQLPRQFVKEMSSEDELQRRGSGGLL